MKWRGTFTCDSVSLWLELFVYLYITDVISKIQMSLSHTMHPREVFLPAHGPPATFMPRTSVLASVTGEREAGTWEWTVEDCVRHTLP